MERRVTNFKNYSIAGFLFVSALGTLLHFVYEWSGNNPVAGIFAPINESTWEHMKLLFFPMILFLIFAAIRLPHRSSYPTALMLGTIIGLICIPVLFYTYSGILGFHAAAIDIGIFYLSVLLTFLTAHWLSSRENVRIFLPPALLLLCLFGVSFVVFTFFPPELGIFQDPTVLQHYAII